MKRRFLAPMLCLIVVFAATFAAAAESPAAANVLRHRDRAALKDASARETHSNAIPNAGCTPIPLSPPANISGSISTSSCYDSVINGYEDIYNLSGVAGQKVTIDYYTTAYEVFLYMEGVAVDYVSFRSTSGVSHDRIVYTFPTTRTYKLEAETLYGPGDGQPYTGPYTLTVTTTAGPTCTPNSTTMCLNNDRFAVSATYNTGTQNGNAQAVKLTTDSGYLTFFSTTNVEVVIKVLDGCGINSRYWVYAGGLTNVNAVITVRDTKTGTVKTYTNPANTPFQPIQDSSALATCP